MLIIPKSVGGCTRRTLREGAACKYSSKLKNQTRQVLPDGSVLLSADMVDGFNFVNHPEVSYHPERGEVTGFSCDCPDTLAGMMLCRHCVALLLSIGESVTEAPAPVSALQTGDQSPTVVILPGPQPAVTVNRVVAPASFEVRRPEPQQVPPAPVPRSAGAPSEPKAAPEPEEAAPEPEEAASRNPVPTLPPEPEKGFVGPGIEVVLGHNLETEEPVCWHPNDTEQLFHTNTGIIGTMGTGKTQFTKSLITQLNREGGKNYGGSAPGILIFDYKGDYNETKADFVRASCARVFKPYRLPYNPLAIHHPVTFRPLLPIHTANAFKDTISKIYRLGPKQQQLLLDCIVEAYRKNGIKSDDPATWDRRAPTFEQVYGVYQARTEGKGSDSLAAAMNKLHHFCIFEERPQKVGPIERLLQGVVVFDISGYDPDIQSLVIAITLDQFYGWMTSAGSSSTDGRYRELRQLILVDEADNFMSEGFPALRKILKEGREFGVGTVLSTQSLTHFLGGSDDYSRYILTWVVHAAGDLKQKDVENIFKLPPKSPLIGESYARIKSLAKHQSLVRIGEEDPQVIRDLAFWQLISQDAGQ